MAELTTEQLKEKVALLEKDLKIAQEGKAKAETDLAAAKQVIEDTEVRMAELEAGKPQLPVFTVDKDQYELVSAFTWQRQEVTIELLKSNPKLAKELIKEGVQLIRKIEK